MRQAKSDDKQNVTKAEADTQNPTSRTSDKQYGTCNLENDENVECMGDSKQPQNIGLKWNDRVLE